MKIIDYFKGIAVLILFLALLVLGGFFLGLIVLGVTLIYSLIFLIVIILAIFILPFYLGKKNKIFISKKYSIKRIKK